VLTRLTPPGNVPGTVRSAAGEDAGWLRSALRAFADEANVPMSDASVQRYVRDRLDEGGYRIREVDATRVAFAGFSAAGPDASRIAPVYTLPAFRKQGHAGALVAAVCAELLASRPRVFLVTDLANPTSNALYRRLGFEPLDDTVAFELLDCT
jgi:predicted GNAT family acetyltransferase